MCKVHAHSCKQLPFHSLFSSSCFPVLPLLPGANQRQPQALHWKDLSDESLTDSIESYETEGTQDSRRRNIERGMYDHAHTNMCPYVGDIFNAVAISTCSEVWELVKLCLLRVWNLYLLYMWCHWYLPCCLYEPTVSNRLHLIDYYEGLGARGIAIKD